MTNANDLVCPSEVGLDHSGNRVSDLSKSVVLVQENGITKREYFAGLAMQGIVAGMNNDVIVGHRASDTVGVVGYAVNIADALIEQLNKSTNE